MSEHPDGQDLSPADNRRAGGVPAAGLEQRRFLAQVLVTGADAIARSAASMMLERFEDVARRYKPLSYDRWKENFAGRVAELAAGVLAGDPRVFVDQIAWARVAFEARGVPVDDLLRSIDVLGEAVDRHVPPEDRAYVQRFITAAGRSFYDQPAPASLTLDHRTPAGELAARYLLAILEGDRLAAFDLALRAVREGGYRALDFYDSVLAPAQRELGRLWHLGDLTVAEEHFATATTQMVMSQLHQFIERAPRHGKVVVAASVEGNLHDLGVRIVADFLEASGYRVVFLGQSVPGPDLAQAVDHFHADVLAISAYLPMQLRAIEDAIRMARGAERGSALRIIVGGPAFLPAPGVWRELGADGCATSARDAVALADRLTGRATSA